MSTEAYQLPNFIALLPKKPGGKINPHFKEAETEFNAWVGKEFGSRAEELCRCGTPLVAALIYPHASYQQLKGFIDYMSATFLVDDLFGRVPTKDALAVTQLWSKALQGESEAKSIQDPVLEMIGSKLMLDTEALAGSYHWPQFIAQNEVWLMREVQEARDREVYLNTDNAALDIQSYLVKRRLIIGINVGFVFVRSTRSLCIPDDILANPVIVEMEDATTEMVVIVNDLHSFNKEYKVDGAFTNILTVMQKDPKTAHLNFQERLDYAGELFKAALERFHACRRDLPSFNPEIDQYLTLYADGLLDLAVGNVEWSRVCRRYSVFTNEEDRKNNIMRLAL